MMRNLRAQSWRSNRPALLSNPISQALTTAQVWLQGTPQVPELFPQLQAPVESGVCTRTNSGDQHPCQQQRDEGSTTAKEPNQHRHHCWPCGAEVRGTSTIANLGSPFRRTCRVTQREMATLIIRMRYCVAKLSSVTDRLTFTRNAARKLQRKPRHAILHQMAIALSQVTSSPGAGGIGLNGRDSTRGALQSEHVVNSCLYSVR